MRDHFPQTMDSDMGSRTNIEKAEAKARAAKYLEPRKSFRRRIVRGAYWILAFVLLSILLHLKLVHSLGIDNEHYDEEKGQQPVIELIVEDGAGGGNTWSQRTSEILEIGKEKKEGR